MYIRIDLGTHNSVTEPELTHDLYDILVNDQKLLIFAAVGSFDLQMSDPRCALQAMFRRI